MGVSCQYPQASTNRGLVLEFGSWDIQTHGGAVNAERQPMTSDFALEPAPMTDVSRILPLVEELHNAEHIEMDADDCAFAVKTPIEWPEIGGIWVIRAEEAVIGNIVIASGFSLRLAAGARFWMKPELQRNGVVGVSVGCHRTDEGHFGQQGCQSAPSGSEQGHSAFPAALRWPRF
jgi:hypothetical protein